MQIDRRILQYLGTQVLSTCPLNGVQYRYAGTVRPYYCVEYMIVLLLSIVVHVRVSSIRTHATTSARALQNNDASANCHRLLGCKFSLRSKFTVWAIVKPQLGVRLDALRRKKCYSRHGGVHVPVAEYCGKHQPSLSGSDHQTTELSLLVKSNRYAKAKPRSFLIVRRTHLRKNVWIGSVMIEESTYVSLPFGIYHELSSWPSAGRTIDIAVCISWLYLEDHLIRCVSSGLRLCTKIETQQYIQNDIGHNIACLWLCNRGQIEVGTGQCTEGLVLTRLACDCEDLADVRRQKRAQFCPKESLAYCFLVRLRNLLKTCKLQQRVEGEEGDIALRHRFASFRVNIA